MTATINLKEAREQDPEFFETPARREYGWWTIIGDGDNKQILPPGTPVRIESPFGSVEIRVVPNPDGTPNHDKIVVEEASNVNMIVWYRNRETKQIMVAILHETRHHSDNLENPESTEPITFGQIPMGFANKFEVAYEAALREASEEVGVKDCVEVTRPEIPIYNVNPTLFRSTSQLVFLECDPDRIEEANHQYGEFISKIEFISVPELLRRIAVGKHDGAFYRAGTSLATLMVFLATYREEFFKTT